jgi:hypothetical protein
MLLKLFGTVACFSLLILSIRNLFYILNNQFIFYSKYFHEWISEGTRPYIKLIFIILTGFIFGIFFSIIHYWKKRGVQNELLLYLNQSKSLYIFVLFSIITYFISELNFFDWGKESEVFVRILVSFSILIILYMISVFIETLSLMLLSRKYVR